MSRKRNNEEDFIPKSLEPKTRNQSNYIRCIETYTLTIGLSVAGTGKTYIAVCKAAEMFLKGKVKKIVITRPMVECGEKIGFLPGDIEEKSDPYLRHIYDILQKYFSKQQLKDMKQNDEIEICPLAFMRGRTFDDAFVILDEGQNATYAQLKMFITRIGVGSTVVINGDVTQSDLPTRHKYDITDFVEKVKHDKDVAVARLYEEDIVRSGFVQRIVCLLQAKDEEEDNEEKSN